MFRAYPVPAANVLNISGLLSRSGKVKLSLYNNLGQEVMNIANGEAPVGLFNKVLDISSLPAGVYMCKIETESEATIQHVVIQK
jgi:hypothetical protein